MKAMLARNLKFDPSVNYSSYIMQQKFDGDRVIFNKGVPLNRNGDPYTKAIPAELQQEVDTYFYSNVLDGELVEGVYQWFDIVDDPTEPYEDRYTAMKLMSGLPLQYIRLAKNYSHTNPNVFRELDWEGVILRDANSVYEQGRSKNLLKYKFVERADVIITRVPTEDMQSVEVAVFAENGDGQITLGNINMWPHRNKFDIYAVEEGSIIEVEYLYVVDHGDAFGMVQGQFKNKRPDKYPLDCTVGQLKTIKSRNKNVRP